MFTGTDINDIYCLEDEEEIQREEKRKCESEDRELNKEETEEVTAFNKKYEQKRRDIRKWIYSYPLKPGIKIVSENTCGCNMGHCGAILGLKLDKTVYKTVGKLFALFSSGSNIPCYARFSGEISLGGECNCHNCNSEDDDPWYEHPDGVLLYLERVDKDKVYKVYPHGHYVSEVTSNVKLELTDEDSKYTIMSWSYGR